MAAPSPYEYGISVSDPAAWAAALGALGFEAADTASDSPPVGETPERTLVNATSGQCIHLYQRDGAAPDAPAAGDVTIGIPVQGEPEAALQALRGAAPGLSVAGLEELPREKGIAVIVDGQRLVLTSKREPFTVVHYPADAWEEVLEFYEDVLGFCFFPLPDRGTAVRTRLENAAGRVDLEADPGTKVLRGARNGHFRLVNAKLGQAQERMPGSRHGEWLTPPEDGRAWATGPAGERMELIEKPDR